MRKADRNGQIETARWIGIKDRRYLDKSGLQRHRGVADLMRYAALNQGVTI